MNPKNIVVVILSLILGILAIWFFYPAFKYTRSNWPKIDDSSKLLLECKLLLQDDYGIIEEENWPESVKILHPIDVFAGSDFVNILISLGGISHIQCGYIIYPDGRENPDALGNYIMKGSVCPGVFRYERDNNERK